IAQIAAQIDALKRQARQAVRYRAVAAQLRKAEALLCHLRWVGANAEVEAAAQAQAESVRVVADATGAQAQASRYQAEAAASLPSLREAETRAAAALQRLVIAREPLDREEARAKERIAELDRRLVQLGDDAARERRLAADAQAALDRLDGENAALAGEAEVATERERAVAERMGAAETALAASEKTFGDLTGALADLTARRNQLERAVREHSERLVRLAGEIGGGERGLWNPDRAAG